MKPTDFKLQDDDIDTEKTCKECGEKLSPDGTCPVCSPKDDDEINVDINKEFE